MIRNSIVKLVSISLIAGLNLTGLSAIMETSAYLNDTEASPNNIYTASTLDFSLNSLADFLPEVTPTQNSVRDISVIKDGILDFEYNLKTEDETGDLCDNLNLTVTRNGADIGYAGTLKDFTYGAGQFFSPDDWQFTASLIGNDPSWENKTCDFDFVFDGAQIGGAGFYDQEIISNTINSGSWTEPTTSSYSPIADSYVSEKSPDSNYGSDSELEVRSKDGGSGHENKRTYIKFDFHLPTGTVVSSAIMKLYMKDTPSSSRTYDAKRVLGNWKERDPNGIDWNNKPDVDAITNSVSTGDNNPKWLSWDVTNDVQSFISGTANYGWRLSDSAENSLTSYEGKFHSRESNDADKRPILEITFTPPEVTTDHLVVNEVYYDVGSGKGDDPNNEWVEIYNPTESAVDISGWKICETAGCDVIPSSAPIPAHGFAVASGKSSTWEDYWTLPEGTITIDLPGDKIGSNGLSDDGDRVELRKTDNSLVDAMSYGDDTTYFELPLSGKGKSLARIIKGYDNDLATDWIINATPNPGTNPSIDGIETITFTYQGIEFLGSGPVSNEEGVPNDLPEESDAPIIEEAPVIETGVSVSGAALTDEVFGGTTIIEEVPVETITEEVPVEPAEEVIPEVVPEVVPEEPPVIIEEQPTVVEEPPVVVEEPVIVEPPVPPPVEPPAPTE